MDDIMPSQHGPAAWFKVAKADSQMVGDAHS
jgi:hypothetical protein